MKIYTIHLDDDTAHRIEVRAAIDDLTPEQGIQYLLTHIICEFEETRQKSNRLPQESRTGGD